MKRLEGETRVQTTRTLVYLRRYVQVELANSTVHARTTSHSDILFMDLLRPLRNLFSV